MLLEDGRLIVLVDGEEKLDIVADLDESDLSSKIVNLKTKWRRK
jgi:hypothetical protein